MANLVSRSPHLGGLASILLLFCGVTTERSLAVEADTTLLLYDVTNADSVAIKDHYLGVHPGVQAFGLSLPNFGEEILAQEYLDAIRQPVLDHLNSQGLGSDIDTFVTTKGLPLRIDAGVDPNPGPQSNWKRYSSLESELTRIDTISSIAEMGDQSFSDAILDVPGVKPANPYYLGLEYDLFTLEPLPYNGPEGFDRSDPINENIRLTSRLDGYTRQDVIDMVDRAQQVFVVPFGHSVVIDDDPDATAAAESAMENLAQNILPSHGQLTNYDDTDNAITNDNAAVIGYVSHGTQDRSGGLQAGYIQNQLQFELANGAVFHTYESYNGKSFDPGFSQSQGLIAEWIAIGGTAGLGHVAEPGASSLTVTNEDIFFDMLLSGFTLAEAAWSATRQLSYVNTVVGDPLMKWQEWLPGDANFDGIVDISDFGLMVANWFQPGTVNQGEFSGDGFIDISDFGILRAHWFQSVNNGGVAALTIPEPSSALLLATVLGPLLTWLLANRKCQASLRAQVAAIG